MVLSFLVLAFLSACGGSKSSSGGDSNGGSGSGSPPAPSSLKWGDLDCQKQKNCDNPILNINQYLWSTSLERSFVEGSTVDKKIKTLSSSDEKVFICGSDFYEFVANKLASEGLNVVPEIAEVNEFARKVLVDFSSCRAHADVPVRLDQFFQDYLKEHGNESLKTNFGSGNGATRSRGSGAG